MNSHHWSEIYSSRRHVGEHDMKKMKKELFHPEGRDQFQKGKYDWTVKPWTGFWEITRKATYGVFPKSLKEADEDRRETNQWFRSVGIKAETQALNIDSQEDQSLATTTLYMYHHRVNGSKCSP